MTRLSPAGVDRLLELIGDVNGLGTLRAFRGGLLDALHRAVPALYASYNEVGAAGTWAFSQPPLDEVDVGRWAARAEDHPVLAHMRRTRDGRPRRISDHLDPPAFRRTALYREFYGPLGVESQVAFGLPAAPPLVIGVALSRGDEDFTDDEVELLARARPHLIQAYRSAHAAERRERLVDALERGLAADGRSAVVVDRGGEVRHAGASAGRVLGLAPRVLEGRPVLDDALRQAIRAARTAGHPGPHRVAGGDGRSPTVRALLARDDDGLDVLLVDDADGGLTVERLRSLGLTRREAETLRWIALGRTAPDAARAMGISPRTAGKHLEAAYAKLGVTNRSDAARTAWAAVDPAGG